MSENSDKSWSRSWSTDEIIQNSSNWSLAGDAGLLKYLESFSEKLLTRAEDTNKNVNKLVDDLNRASLSLDMVTSEFSSLRNIQFIESRVYEDDETLASDETVQKEHEDKKSEEDNLLVIKEAIMTGINVVNKYFDKVEVPVSDTEDETDFPNFVLRPKDPYIDRPLPYIIGTEEWHKKWHVGLLDSSSDSEAEKVSEKFSDSDSDDDLLNKNKVPIKRLSNSGSEMDTSDRLDMKYPVANSTFEDCSKPTDILGSSNSEEYNAVPAPRSFAEELSAKLGNVVDQTIKANEPEINQRPIQQSTVTSKTVGNIFFDEPPPIDEDDELFGSSKTGIFSGGDGLFDDFDKVSSVEKEKADTVVKEVTRSQIPNLFDDDDDEDFFISSNQEKVVPKISGGLFDDDNDLFQENINNSIKSYLEPAPKTTMPFFDDEPPALEPKTNILKKPIGDVKVFENKTMANLLKSRRQDSADSSFDEVLSAPAVQKSKNMTDTKEEETEGQPKHLSLFDDDDCLDFEDNLFSNISSKKFSSNLFDNDPIMEEFNKVKDSKEIIAPVEKEQNVIKPSSEQLKNKSSLFEDLQFNAKLNNFNIQLNEDVPECDQNPPDLDENWDTKSDNNLFNDDGMFDNIQEISSRRSGLFDDEPPSLLNESSGIVPDPSTRMETDDSFNPYASSSRRLSSDIFNDQQSNDSFFVTKHDSLNVQSQLQSIPETEGSSKSFLEITASGNVDDLFAEITVSADEKSNRKKVPEPLFTADNLFNAPTGEKEGESENILDKEGNGIRRKIGSPGKLKHNLNIDVSALVPGVSPPKRKPVTSPVEDSITHVSTKPLSSRINVEGACETDKSRPNSDFDNHLSIPQVLPSITKDRARIPVKRRPSTRKARQKLIRNSMTDFKINVESYSDEELNDAIMTEDTAKDKTDVFVDIFEENNIDLFSSLNLIKSEISETDRQGINNNNNNDKPCQSENVSESNVAIADNRSVINSDSFESNDLKKSDLFEDSEDFDDVFSSKKLPPKSIILKKSLFDDDDEDDLFGPSTTSKKPKPIARGPNNLLQTKPTKSTYMKKLVNLEAAEDPLSLFDGDDDDDN